MERAHDTGQFDISGRKGAEGRFVCHGSSVSRPHVRPLIAGYGRRTVAVHMAVSPPPPPARTPKPSTTPKRPVSPMTNAFRSRRFWITLLVLLAANLFITNVLLAPAQPTTITLPYNVCLLYTSDAADDLLCVD